MAVRKSRKVTTLATTRGAKPTPSTPSIDSTKPLSSNGDQPVVIPSAQALPPEQRRELFREISVNRHRTLGLVPERLYNPDELAGRRGLNIYSRMLADDQVKAALTLKQHAVLSPGWDIEPASDSPQDLEVSEFVKFCLEDLEGSLDDDLLEILSSLCFGFSLSEIVYRPITNSQYNGKIGLRALKTRLPHDFVFVVDSHDNLLENGIEQFGKRMPTEKFIIHSANKTFDNWYGTSDLRAAYRSWWMKENVLKWWAMFMDRYSIPLAEGVVPRGGALGDDAVTALRTALDNLQAATSIVHPDDVTLNFPAVASAQGAQIFVAAINAADQAIARALLLPNLLGVSAPADTGSFSQARKHFDVFILVVEKLQHDLADQVMGDQVIRRLVDLNYRVEDYPVFTFLPFTETDKSQLLGLWYQAIAAGAVQTRPEDEVHVRSITGFPDISLEELQAEADAAKAQEQVGGGFPGGLGGGLEGELGAEGGFPPGEGGSPGLGAPGGPGGGIPGGAGGGNPTDEELDALIDEVLGGGGGKAGGGRHRLADRVAEALKGKQGKAFAQYGKGYDPSQPRDEDGKWIETGAETYNAGSTERALSSFMQNTHLMINGVLRGAVSFKGEARRKGAELARAISAGFDNPKVFKTTTKDRTLVYRGINSQNAAYKLGQLRKGQLFSDPGFLSTSWSSSIAEKVTDPSMDNAMLVIYIPKATRYLSGRPDERELIFRHGTTLRVVDVRKSGLRVEIDAELVRAKGKPYAEEQVMSIALSPPWDEEDDDGGEVRKTSLADDQPARTDEGDGEVLDDKQPDEVSVLLEQLEADHPDWDDEQLVQAAVTELAGGGPVDGEEQEADGGGGNEAALEDGDLDALLDEVLGAAGSGEEEGAVVKTDEGLPVDEVKVDEDEALVVDGDEEEGASRPDGELEAGVVDEEELDRLIAEALARRDGTGPAEEGADEDGTIKKKEAVPKEKGAMEPKGKEEAPKGYEFDESKHPREPGGSEGGGRFAPAGGGGGEGGTAIMDRPAVGKVSNRYGPGGGPGAWFSFPKDGDWSGRSVKTAMVKDLPPYVGKDGKSRPALAGGEETIADGIRHLFRDVKVPEGHEMLFRVLFSNAKNPESLDNRNAANAEGLARFLIQQDDRMIDFGDRITAFVVKIGKTGAYQPYQYDPETGEMHQYEFDEAEHPRAEEGTETGGQFVPKGGGAGMATKPRERASDKVSGRDLARRLQEEMGVSPEMASRATKEVERINAAFSGRSGEYEPGMASRSDKTQGNCYEFAGRFVLDGERKGMKLVHGYVIPPIGPLEGTKMGHGWVDLGDTVFDPTLQKFFSKADYETAFQPVAEKTYDKETMLKMALRKKNWGPWHETAGVYNPLKRGRRKA